MGTLYRANDLFISYNERQVAVIYRSKINSLSDEEKGALLYILNRGDGIKVDLNTVVAYKPAAIQRKLKEGMNLIKNEHREFYERLCGSFDVYF